MADAELGEVVAARLAQRKRDLLEWKMRLKEPGLEENQVAALTAERDKADRDVAAYESDEDYQAYVAQQAQAAQEAAAAAAASQAQAQAAAVQQAQLAQSVADRLSALANELKGLTQ